MDTNGMQQLADRYGNAWNEHDVDGVLALQADDMTFHLHVEGSDPVTGH